MTDRLNHVLKTGCEASTKEDKERSKKEQKQVRQFCEHADKQEKYDKKPETPGKLNSYSKTDKNTTFMSMKKDTMLNGQTNPAYNLQIGIENWFILFVHQRPFTMISFPESHHERYNKLPATVVAESGFGSEENYCLMDETGITAFVKYNRFHIE